MEKDIVPTRIVAPVIGEAWQGVGASFGRFCLAAGIANLREMMERDAAGPCGGRHGRDDSRLGHRWGGPRVSFGLHGGEVAIERLRVRTRGGAELARLSWQAAEAEDWLGRWALKLMLLDGPRRRLRRAVRLPGTDVPAPPGAGISNSWAWRRFVALSAAQLRRGWAAELGRLNVLAIQIDGMHLSDELTLPAAVGARRQSTASSGREYDWHGPPRLPKCQTVAQHGDGVTLDRSGDAAGSEGPPSGD